MGVEGVAGEMNEDDFRRITSAVAQGQGREFTAEDLDLWEMLLHDLRGKVALDATLDLLKRPGFITPAAIREQYDALVRKRLSAIPLPPPPSRLTPDEYQEWLRAHNAAVIAGDDAQEAQQKALAAVGRSENRMLPPAQRDHDQIERRSVQDVVRGVVIPAPKDDFATG